MIKRVAAAAVLALAVAGATGLPAFAQDTREVQLIGLHQLCNQGDRKACIRFGMMLQQNHDRTIAWRQTHPEWFWWER